MPHRTTEAPATDQGRRAVHHEPDADATHPCAENCEEPTERARIRPRAMQSDGDRSTTEGGFRRRHRAGPRSRPRISFHSRNGPKEHRAHRELRRPRTGRRRPRGDPRGRRLLTQHTPPAPGDSGMRRRSSARPTSGRRDRWRPAPKALRNRRRGLHPAAPLGANRPFARPPPPESSERERMPEKAQRRPPRGDRRCQFLEAHSAEAGASVASTAGATGAETPSRTSSIRLIGALSP